MSNEAEKHHLKRIHIDRKEYHSVSPTTGKALYLLGKVHEGYDLFEEEQGNREDKKVPNGDEEIHLFEDEHFFSAEHHDKGITVIVNATEELVEHKHRLSFEQVVAYAFPTSPGGDNLVFTVTYYNGPHHKPDGTLLPGQKVHIKNGMVFDVTATNRS